MLLAPMVFDDQVLGVLVLSKLGLDRFTDDDLRLLVIYASFAAQAMANADTTERLREQTLALEQQLRGQRELLQITESILTTLDARGVLESITDRLGGLIACDNVAIEVVDPATGLLTPLTARGVHAADYLEPWAAGRDRRRDLGRRAQRAGRSSATSAPIRGSTTSATSRTRSTAASSSSRCAAAAARSAS